MDSNEYKPNRRIQESLLAYWEGKALYWLAGRMPAWVNSDHLTILGFASTILAGILYYFSGVNPLLLHVVNLCIVANWFGDSLDGTLARYRNRQRPRYGYYVDHITDSFGTLFLVGGLAFSGYLTERIGLVLLVAYFLLSIESYLVANTLGEFRISFYRFSPTELRALLIVGNLFLISRPRVELFGRSYLLFDIGGVIAAVLMIVIATISAISHTKRLYRLERI